MNLTKAIWLQLTLYSVIAAAIFGAVHDQVSYSVSPEYFTLLKFQQFHLVDLDLPLRLKAALVGVLATWWMGLPLGLGLAFAAIRWHGEAAITAYWRVLPWLMLVALAGAGIGLAAGYWQTQDLTQFAHKRLPVGLQDVRSYLTVGLMHKASYLSGGVALAVGWLQLYWRRPRHDG